MLGSYNDYRELCRFPRVTAFDQISGNEKVQRRLGDHRVDRNLSDIVHRNVPGSEKYFISLTRKGWRRK